MDIGKRFEYIHDVLSITNPTILCGALTIIAGMVWMHQRHLHLPPGPPLYIPGLGHLLKLVNNPLLAFRSLRSTYGDIFKIYMGTRLTIVLNGYEVINEVMQIRGSEFSHRPPSFLAEKLAEYKGLLNSSGKVWVEQKANIMKSFRALSSCGSHFDLHLETEVERFNEKLMLLVKDGQAGNVDVTPYIRKSVCSSAFNLVFGRFLDYDSKELTMFSESLSQVISIGSLAVLNFIPYAHLLPGDPVSYHRCLDLVKIIEDDLINQRLSV
uniref:Cytochrome P450 n=1 Tax=Arion vulgaris TaxID=1028688 RepID=A0A0B7AK88_9EUPU